MRILRVLTLVVKIALLDAVRDESASEDIPRPPSDDSLMIAVVPLTTMMILMTLLKTVFLLLVSHANRGA